MPDTSSMNSQYFRTHGQPTGFSVDHKKAVKMKFAGGSMQKMLANQYYHESKRDAMVRNEYMRILKNSSKFDIRKNFVNRAY